MVILPSSEISHDSAKSGIISRSLLSVTKPENISTIIDAEVVSVTNAGSSSSSAVNEADKECSTKTLAPVPIQRRIISSSYSLSSKFIF